MMARLVQVGNVGAQVGEKLNVECVAGIGRFATIYLSGTSCSKVKRKGDEGADN